MLSVNKIGSFEAFCLMSFLLGTKIFFTNVKVIIDRTGTAGWYTTIISFIITMFFFSLLCILINKFEGLNIIDIFNKTFGWFLGSIFSILFSGYALFYSSSVLREFFEMLKAYNLPYTPPSIIVGLFLIVTCIYLYVGLDGISKICVLAFFVVLAGTITIYLLGIPNYNPSLLTPLGGYGLRESVLAGILRSSAYSEVFFLAVIVTSLKDTRTFKKVGFYSLSFIAFIFCISILFSLMTFGYTSGSELLSGIFQLSRLIYYNRFIQRLESLFLFIWVIAAFFNVTISAYFSLNIYCQVFKIKNHRPLIPSFIFLIFYLTFLPESLISVKEMNLTFIYQYSLFFIYTIPILALILSSVSQNKSKLKAR